MCVCVCVYEKGEDEREVQGVAYICNRPLPVPKPITYFSYILLLFGVDIALVL